MPESLLRILQFLLLALLYLFFFRVLRAVWAEVSSPRDLSAGAGPPRGRTTSPRDRGGPAAPKGAPGRLRVLEPADRKGQAFDLGEELTVGRASGCQVKVEDTYASQLHARIFRKNGELFVEDLGSTNGTYVGNQRLTRSTPVTARSRFRLGKTVVELRK